MNAFDFLKQLHDNWCHFQSREGKKVGRASYSELKRWMMNGAVLINSIRVKPTDVINFPIETMILFPNNPVTLK
jgi:hypothetical protein